MQQVLKRDWYYIKFNIQVHFFYDSLLISFEISILSSIHSYTEIIHDIISYRTISLLLFFLGCELFGQKEILSSWVEFFGIQKVQNRDL